MRPRIQNKQPKVSPNILNYLFILFFAIIIFSSGIFIGEKGILGRKLTSGTFVSQGSDNLALPEDLDYSSVEEVYDIVRKSYDGDLTQSAFLDELKQGIAKATGDPYTEFFNSVKANEFSQELSGTFTGIGAELGKSEGNLVVVSPLAGYPAEKAGLKPNDVIARINDEDSSDISVYEAISKIRGEAGTEVNLTLVRNKTEVVEVSIVRAVIDVPSVKSEIQDEIGIITISQFSDDTSGLLEKYAKELTSQGVKGIILDLRGNPGGYLEQAVEVSGLWLDESKLAVEVRKGSKVQESLYAKGSKRLQGLPTVVLINEGSASASEIVAGALQDHKVATLIGKKSFGKGSVQNISQLKSNELIKITTARWYTPNGNNIDKEGIKPDIEVDLTDEDFNEGRDPQLDKALDLLK